MNGGVNLIMVLNFPGHPGLVCEKVLQKWIIFSGGVGGGGLVSQAQASPC